MAASSSFCFLTTGLTVVELFLVVGLVIGLVTFFTTGTVFFLPSDILSA